MDPALLKMYQREVARQLKFAFLALDALKPLLIEEALDSPGGTDKAWAAVQAFVVAWGNASKLLWPRNPQAFASRKDLRDSLEASDHSALRSRAARDRWEHFDKELDAWAASSARRSVADSGMAPVDWIIGVDPTRTLRILDPEQMVLYFSGRGFELVPVVEEMKVLFERVRAKLAT